MKFETLSWQKCPALRAIDITKWKVFSFDVFDTVLHRAVREPKELFVLLGEQAVEQNLLDPALSAHDLANLRERMEIVARNRKKGQQASWKSGEVSLADIWQEAPWYLSPREQYLRLELNIEHSLCFANPYLLSFINALARQGKTICFASDTYFSADFITRLLAKGGVDNDCYVKIFTSCEYGKNKASGALFSELLGYFSSVSPGDILHIGDNLTGDYVQPRRLGLVGAHLDTLQPQSDQRQREALVGVHEIPDPIYFVRQLGRMVRPAKNVPDSFFLEFGAAVIGPVVASFCTWLVSDAIQRGLTLLCPLMREGGIFAPMMRRAAKAMGSDIEVQEFYASRRAAFLPAMGELDGQALAQFRSRRNYSLKNFLEELQLPMPASRFIALLDKPFSEACENAELLSWLRGIDIQDLARKSSASARELFMEYASGVFGQHRRIGFVDLGPGGNTLAWMAKCLDGYLEIGSIQYLLHSTPEVSQHAAKGLLYATFLGTSPQAARISRLINRSHEPLEVILTGRRQTTIGYQRQAAGRKVVPITECVNNLPEQDILLKSCEEGLALAWQHVELAMHAVGIEPVISEESRRASLMQLCRWLELPTHEEASCLGNLFFDDNAGSNTFQAICSMEDHRKVVAAGPVAFIKQARRQWGYRANAVRWPQGAVTQIHPDFLVGLHGPLFNDLDHRFLCRDLLVGARENGHTAVTVYGAGKIGFEMVSTAKQMGILVDFVVDSNVSMHGQLVAATEIVALEKAQKAGSRCFVVASVAFADEIVKAIKGSYIRSSLQLPEIFSMVAGT